jgi:hypothetical protein
MQISPMLRYPIAVRRRRLDDIVTAWAMVGVGRHTLLQNRKSRSQMTSLYRLIADIASRAHGLCDIRFALLILALVVLSPSGAKAISSDEAIDFAVDAAVQGGRFIGLNVPPDAAHLLKELVKCGVEGGSVADCAKQSVVKTALRNAPEEVQKIAGCLVGNADPLGCAKQLGLDQVPPEARPMVECMLGGGNVADCAGKAALGEALAKVPPEVRPILECVANGGPPATCGAQAVADNLPPGEAKDVALCIVNGGSPESCAAQFGKRVVDEATKQATQDVVDKLKQLKADANQAIEEQKGTVKNIIEIAKGIQEGNWEKVLWNGGQELAKIVLTLLIEVLFPPAAAIAGPVVASMVDLYGDLAEKVFNMVVNGQFGELPEILFQFYFSEMIARPCALLPDGGFKDAICGNLAKLIGAAASVVGDAVDFLLDVAETILKATGIYQVGDAIVGLIGDAWDAIFGDGLEDPKVCGPAKEFFAKHYLPCLGAAAGASAAASPVSGAHKACVDNFKRCYKDAEGICNGLDSALNNQASQVNAALDEGAGGYTLAVGSFIYSRRAEICTNGRDASVQNFKNQHQNQFVQQCTDALGKNVPLPVNACAYKPAHMTRAPGPSLACSRALGNSNWEKIVGDTCDAWCRENRDNCKPSPPPCWVHSTQTVVAHGFTYTFSPLDRQLCWMEFPKISDRWLKFINPADIYNDRFGSIRVDRFVTDVFANPAVRNPLWAGTIPAAFNDALPPSLSLGSCRTTRTLMSPTMQWSKTEVLRAPVSLASRTSAVSFLVRLPPPVVETFQLSLKPVALVSGGFESCEGTATLASRGSSGSDGSFTPRSSVKRTPSRGGVAARGGGSQPTSGAYSVRTDPMDRLTGDGTSATAPSTPGFKLPDTSRGSRSGAAARTWGSSGASPVQSSGGGPQGSSGASTVQSSGTSVPRQPQGSSGASSTPTGGASGTFGPGASSGTLRTNRPIIEIYRPQQPQQSSPVR